MKFLTEKITSVKNAVIEDFTSNKKLTADQRDRKRARMIGRMTAGMMAVMMLNKAVRCFPFILQSPHQKSAQSFSWLPQHRGIG